MKRILTYAGLFLAVFIIALLAVFPYSAVVDTVLSELIRANKMLLTYTEVKSGLFHTTVTGVAVNNIPFGGRVIDRINLGDIKLSYSPLSALTRNVSAVLESPYGTANIKYGKSGINADASLNVGRLGGILNFRAAGELEVAARYNEKDKKGSFSLNSGAFTATIPGFMEVKGGSLSGEGTVDGNTIMITSLKTTGDNMVLESAGGRITLDRVDTMRTDLNITGRVKYMGANLDFGVKGTLANPQASMQTPQM